MFTQTTHRPSREIQKKSIKQVAAKLISEKGAQLPEILASGIRFQEVLRSLIEQSPHRKNRSPIWRALNISSAALSQYLSGEARPRLEVLVDLANFFDVSLDHLVLEKHRASDSQDGRISVDQQMDRAIREMREKLGCQTWTTVRVAEALVEKIQEEAERVTSQKGNVVGLLSDDEMLILERHSLNTVVIARNLQYDLVVSDGKIVARQFSEVVASNLMSPAPRPYRFLLEGSPKWTHAVSQFREILQRQFGVSSERLENCHFRTTSMKLFGGMTYYTLDMERLQRERPLLAFALEPFLTPDNRLVFMTRPNQELGGDVLYSSVEAASAILAMESHWNEATPLSSTESSTQVHKYRLRLGCPGSLLRGECSITDSPT